MRSVGMQRYVALPVLKYASKNEKELTITLLRTAIKKPAVNRLY